MRQNSAVLQFSFTTTKSEVLCPNFYLKSISAVTLAKFYGQKDSLSVVNDVWNRAQTIHFQTERWICVTNLNLLRNLRRSIFRPLHEIPDYMDSYWKWLDFTYKNSPNFGKCDRTLPVGETFAHNAMLVCLTLYWWNRGITSKTISVSFLNRPVITLNSDFPLLMDLLMTLQNQLDRMLTIVHVLHKDEIAWCYTYDLDLFIVMIGKKYLVCHLGRAFVSLFFCHRSLNAWPHVPVFYCSTSLTICFLQSIALFLVLNRIWCLTPFWTKSGTMTFHTSEKCWFY